MALPAWVESTELDDATIARYRSMSPDERWRDFCELQALADALLATHPERTAALWFQEERDAAAVALWARLMERKRAATPR